MITAVIVASLMTITMWFPYLIASTLVRGQASTMAGNPRLDDTPIPDWANRLKQAHQNAVENLPAFIGVCVMAQMADVVSPAMILAGVIYNYARAAHYVLYGLSVPFLRTVSFMVSWLATVYIGISSLMILLAN